MSQTIIKELSGKNYFLSSNSGDLYLVPAEFIREYTEDEEKKYSDKISDRIVVFDAENIYEIPCEILSDYRLSSEEKQSFQEKLLSMEPDNLEESILHKGRLILFEYILSHHREKSDVHGYGLMKEEGCLVAKKNQKILKEGYNFSNNSSDNYDKLQRWFEKYN